VSRRTMLLLLTAAAAALVLVMSTRGGDRRPVGTENEFPDINGGSIPMAAGRGGAGTWTAPAPALRACPKLHLHALAEERGRTDLHGVRRRPDQLPVAVSQLRSARPSGTTGRRG